MEFFGDLCPLLSVSTLCTEKHMLSSVGLCSLWTLLPVTQKRILWFWCLRDSVASCPLCDVPLWQQRTHSAHRTLFQFQFYLWKTAHCTLNTDLNFRSVNFWSLFGVSHANWILKMTDHFYFVLSRNGINSTCLGVLFWNFSRPWSSSLHCQIQTSCFLSR